MKRSLITFLIFLVVILIIPSVIVMPFVNGQAHVKQTPKVNEATPVSKPVGPAITVSVYRANKNLVEKVQFKNYLVGVVASEMPAEFNLEALKAQALSARTYIVRQLLYPTDIHIPKGAEVTDTQINQVFMDMKQLQKVWGADYDWKIARIEKAVNETEGQIITYQGQPITPAFFSTSNGYTENAEDYWQNAYPYLKSVPCPWDKNSPKFLGHKVVALTTLERDLNIQLPIRNGSLGKILSRTAGHRVATFEIGGKKYTGRSIREKLNLRSTDFTMEQVGSQVTITTKGYGHGVGMSQYGANGMAQQGKNYKQIVEYFFKNVQVSQMEPYTAQLISKTKTTAKK